MKNKPQLVQLVQELQHNEDAPPAETITTPQDQPPPEQPSLIPSLPVTIPPIQAIIPALVIVAYILFAVYLTMYPNPRMPRNAPSSPKVASPKPRTPFLPIPRPGVDTTPPRR